MYTVLTALVYLHTSSGADAASLFDKLVVRLRDSRDLDLLAQNTNGDVLPVRDLLHYLVELMSRALGIHAALDVRVIDGTLLEEADGVSIIAKTLMWVAQRFGNHGVGVHDES